MRRNVSTITPRPRQYCLHAFKSSALDCYPLLFNLPHANPPSALPTFKIPQRTVSCDKKIAMSTRSALTDKTNTTSKDRRALLAEWKNKAKSGEGSGSSLLASKRGRGLSALGGAARVTGGPVRPTTSGGDTNKRQKTTQAWATSRSTTSARTKFASTTRETSFQIKEDENVEPRSKTIKFAEEVRRMELCMCVCVSSV